MKVFKKHVPKYRILRTKKPQPNNKMTIFKTILNLCHFRVTFPADRFTVYTLSAYMIAEFVSLELCYAGEKKKVIGVFWFFLSIRIEETAKDCLAPCLVLKPNDM